ncbi:general substrate transporter [Thozetella sp. PMI_491]|nr:general substrate transporter [Thozetella sp. PMI_491]
MFPLFLNWIPRNPSILLACIIMTSAIDSVLVGYDSSLMGNLNVMPTYYEYFTLTTATKSLNTAISYMGGAICAFIGGFVVDWRGRKESIFWSAVITLIGAVIQGAAVNIGMFIAGRFIIGLGMGFAQVATPILVAETVPVKQRGFALGLYYACWGVGTLIASGIAPSLVCITILFFIPESPRWLISREYHDEALQLLAIIDGSGRVDDPNVLAQYHEISGAISREDSRHMTLFEALSTKSNRRRLWLTTAFSLFIMLPGTNIVTFYFGSMLSNAGIEDPTTQLQINVVLTAFTLVVAVAGSYFADKFSRKMLCAMSLSGGIVSLYLLGGLTALYGESSNKSGIYATIAMIFLYNGTYAMGMTPLTVLYPPEILSFDIRSVGMGLYTCTTKLAGLFVTMVVPFGLDAIGWKVYIINASIDILMVIYVIIYWVETRHMTLEQIEEVFDGVKVLDHPEADTGEVPTKNYIGMEQISAVPAPVPKA